MEIAKCYSHQVNPEMENGYSMFIVNYVYCFCIGIVLFLLKLQLNLQSLKLNSVCLVLRFGVGFCRFLPGFSRCVHPKKPACFLVSTAVSEPDSTAVLCLRLSG